MTLSKFGGYWKFGASRIHHFQVDNVLTVDGDLNFEDARKLFYLEQCIKESLRVYAVAEVTGRLLLRDSEIKGLFLSKGL